MIHDLENTDLKDSDLRGYVLKILFRLYQLQPELADKINLKAVLYNHRAKLDQCE